MKSKYEADLNALKDKLDKLSRENSELSDQYEGQKSAASASDDKVNKLQVELTSVKLQLESTSKCYTSLSLSLSFFLSFSFPFLSLFLFALPLARSPSHTSYPINSEFRGRSRRSYKPIGG